MIAHPRDSTFDVPLVPRMNLQGQGIIRLLQFSGALSTDNRKVSSFVRTTTWKAQLTITTRNSASRFGETLWEITSRPRRS